MKAGVLFTGSGPILILTSYASLTDPQLLEKLEAKGITKFIAHELPIDLVRERYGVKYGVVLGDVNQTNDLRVLDYNGFNIFHHFSLADLGAPIHHEPKEMAGEA